MNQNKSRARLTDDAISQVIFRLITAWGDVGGRKHRRHRLPRSPLFVSCERPWKVKYAEAFIYMCD